MGCIHDPSLLELICDNNDSYKGKARLAKADKILSLTLKDKDKVKQNSRVSPCCFTMYNVKARKTYAHHMG